MKIWPRHSLAAAAALSVILGSATLAEDRSLPAIDETITFFYYEDLESAAHFYEDLLQLPLTMNEDWVRIFRVTSTSSVGLVQDGRGFHAVSADKPAMLSFVTDDVDAWYEHLRNANVTMLSELSPPGEKKEPGAGPVRGFIAEDPGGYTVEFFSWRESTGRRPSSEATFDSQSLILDGGRRLAIKAHR